MNYREIVFRILVNGTLMTAVTLLFTLLLRPLRKVQSARIRRCIWWILAIGFLTPYKPYFFGTAVRVTGKRYGIYNAIGPDGSVIWTDDYLLDSPVWHLLRTAFVIWLIGAAAVGAVMLYRHVQFQKSILRLRQPADEHTYTMLQLVCLQTGCASDIAVYTLPVITTPMMTGLTQPAILLPQQSFTDEELRLILKHELIHRKRRDLLCKLFWMICQAVYWFIPLMPLFIRQMEQDCELACDEEVMENESPETGAVYCNSILHAAMQSSRQRGVRLATGFCGSREMLRSRMQVIMQRGMQRKLIPLLAGTAVLVALTGSFAAYAEENTPISPAVFTPPVASETEMSAVMTTAPVASSAVRDDFIESSAVYTEPAFTTYTEPMMTTRMTGVSFETTATMTVPPLSPWNRQF